MPPNNRPGSVAKKESHTNWKFPGKLVNEAQVLHAIYPKFPVEKYQLMVDDIRNLIISLVRNHGYTDGPKRYNIIKNYTISLIEGRQPENPEWLATSEKFKVPSKLGSETIKLVVDYLEQSENPATRDDSCYQAILTLLNIIRKVKGLSEPDYKSITESAKPINKDLIAKFKTYVKNKLKPYKYKFDPVSFSEFPLSLKKKGPNGIPKVESAHMEAKRLVQDKLFRPWKNLCSCLKADHLLNYVISLSELELSDENSVPGSTHLKTKVSKKHKVQLRVVVPIPDAGCKTRIVAISDYWSQLLLEPVRAHVQETTNKLFVKTDFRLDQNAGISSMVRLQEMCINGEEVKGHKFDSSNLAFLDASTWTDRFHRDLQKEVMKELFNPSIAESWAQLVVHCDWFSPALGRTIKYGQGQGMGTNGSFDIAVLTDHLLINMLIDDDEVLSDIHHNDLSLYGKVGDDLFVYNYQPLLKVYKEINLPINLNKSKLVCKLGSVAEFCARTYINGKDVSRISPNIISKSKDFKYLPNLIALCHSRGISLTSSLFPYLDHKTKEGETYLDKLQPWLLGLFTLSQVEKSTYIDNFNLQQMIEEGWMVNDEYIHMIHDPNSVYRLAFAHSIVIMSRTMENLQDKIFEIVDGMEFYGDEVIDFLKEDDDLYNQESELSKFLLLGPFKAYNVMTPQQITVLGRYKKQRTLLRSELDKCLELNPESPGETLQMVKDISRICHSSCYDGGSLSYDTEKIYNILTGITKTIDMLSKDFKVLTLDESNLRNVMTYVNYDRICQKWPEVIPQIVGPE